MYMYIYIYTYYTVYLDISQPSTLLPMSSIPTSIPASTRPEGSGSGTDRSDGPAGSSSA